MGQEIGLTGGGQLQIVQEGMWVRLEVLRPDDGRGLYKVWVRGGGGRILLGTLVPERGGLRLCRRISRSELERAGCWPITGGETVLTFSFAPSRWQSVEHPERLVKDVVLQQGMRGHCMRLRLQEQGFCLAEEYHAGRPFPLAALFCLSTVERVDGRWYAVFCFDGEGNPVAPNNEGGDGENSGTS